MGVDKKYASSAEEKIRTGLPRQVGKKQARHRAKPPSDRLRCDRREFPWDTTYPPRAGCSDGENRAVHCSVRPAGRIGPAARRTSRRDEEDTAPPRRIHTTPLQTRDSGGIRSGFARVWSPYFPLMRTFFRACRSRSPGISPACPDSFFQTAGGKAREHDAIPPSAILPSFRPFHQAVFLPPSSGWREIRPFSPPPVPAGWLRRLPCDALECAAEL